MRLFVAVDPSEEVRDRLAGAIDSGRAIAPDAKWVAPASLHLTLFFLGPVAEDALTPVPDAIARAAGRHPRSSFTLATVDTFGRRRRPSVLWCGVSDGREALVALEADVARELVALGFTAEERAFTPHLTLARARSRGGDPALAAARDALADVAFGGSPLAEIVLYRSETGPRGARYTAIARAPLTGSGSGSDGVTSRTARPCSAP